MEKNRTAVLERVPAATEGPLVSFTAAAAAAASVLSRGGGRTVSDWQQVIMARDVTVLWKVVRILGQMPIIAEYSLDNTHCRFCDNQGHVNLLAIKKLIN